MTQPILLVGDLHMADKAPSSATESYQDDLFDLLTHVARLEREMDASAVVFAGDLWHHKQPSRTSHALVLRAIRAFQQFRNPWAVTGNHDISNDVAESVNEKQPLGVLFEAGLNELDGWHPTLPLFGVPWQQRWLHEDTPKDALALWRSAGGLIDGHADLDLSKALVVTHAPIYPPSESASILFELVPTAGDNGLGEAMGHTGSLYYGHIHEDHGIWTDDGVTYCNVGALSRGSLTEYNVARSIKIASWTPEDGFTEIDLPHRPASEVLRIAEVTATREEKKNLDGFLSDIGSSVLDISSTESVIAHIKTMAVEQRVKDTAIEILEGVEV